MIHELTIFVPSRERPHNAARLYGSFLATRRADSELLFVLDDDDPTYDQYCYQLRHGNARVLRVPRGRRGMVDAINSGFKQTQLGYATGFFGDDCLIRTEAWDKIFLENLKELGPYGLVYGNDLLQGINIATHPIMTSNLPKTLGYIALPELQHLCVDIVWMIVAEKLGCLRYAPEVTIEHLHPANRKAKWDDHYAYLNGMEMQNHDGPAHLKYLDGAKFKRDLAKIRKKLDPSGTNKVCDGPKE